MKGHPCPVCNAGAGPDGADAEGFLRCRACGLQYVAAGYKPPDYRLAYGDDTATGINRLGGYHQQLAHGRYLSSLPDVTPCLSGVERRIVGWLRRGVKPGGRVLDLGCGIGRLLMWMDAHGYEAYGVEPAQAPVEMLGARGLRVVEGGTEAVPATWPAPEAVVCVEVLEHVPDPLDFVQRIRAKWPRASLCVAVPDSASRRKYDKAFRQADVPPNHLTRWTRRALEQLVVRAGYQGTITSIHVSAGEIFPPGRAHQRLQEWIVRMGGRIGRRLSARAPCAGQGRNAAASLDDWRAEQIRLQVRRLCALPRWMWLRTGGGSRYWLMAACRPVVT